MMTLPTEVARESGLISEDYDEPRVEMNKFAMNTDGSLPGDKFESRKIVLDFTEKMFADFEKNGLHKE